MKNYKMVIQYDGTRYNGWQRQGNTTNTIQERFCCVLSKMCGRNVEVFASGRTDAGVHAKGQVANFKCDTDLSCEEMLAYLNHYLPLDIKVFSLHEVNAQFHSRLNAKSKTYEYVFATRKADVFIRKYVYVCDACPNIERMQTAAAQLLGTYDFIGFSAVKKKKKSTVRTINSVSITAEDGLVRLRINGSGFLQHMVRIIAGTLLEIGLGEKEPDVISKILNEKNRALAGRTLPSCGLTLLEVFYEKSVLQ